MTAAIEETVAVIETAQAIDHEINPKTYSSEELNAMERLIRSGFLLGPDWTVQMSYEEWLQSAGIPREFAESVEVRAMFARCHPPQWAHHDFFFEMHPELRAAE